MAVVRVPVRFLPEARRNPYEFWRRNGNIPLAALNPAFLDREAFRACIDPTRVNPYVEDIVNGVPVPKIAPNFHPSKNHPLLNGHVDLALNRDACGLSFSSVGRSISVPAPDGRVVEMPFITVELLARIVAPVGGEIQFSQVRSLIYTLYERGFRFGVITFDGWQSIDSIQELTARGYRAVVMSMDRTTSYPTLELQGSITSHSFDRRLVLTSVSTQGQYEAPYRRYFDTLYERRVSIPSYHVVDGQTWLESETIQLEKDEKSGTIIKSVHGTDDLVQAVAASVFHAHNIARVLGITRSTQDDTPPPTRRVARQRRDDYGAGDSDSGSGWDMEKGYFTGGGG